jgi:hypothetical protein
MNRSLIKNSIAFILFVSLLANGLAWAFHEEIYTHELDHHHNAHEPYHHHHTTLTQAENIENNQHNNLADGEIMDSIIHISLHAAGQFQPFYFTLPPSIPTAAGKETLAVFISVLFPESILDSLFRPPRNIFPS